MRIEMSAGTMRRSIVRAVAAVLALAGAACSVGPEFKRPDAAAPRQWSAEATQSFDASLPSQASAGRFDGSRWWTVFGDPVLDRLVADALAQNLDLQATTLRITAARAQLDAAAGARLPNVEGSGIVGRSRMSENGIGQALAGGASQGSGSKPPSTFNLFQAGFDATWELDLFGKVRRNVEASEADLRSAEEARRDAQVSLAAEIARTYFTLRGSERQREIVLADVATQEHLQRLVASRNRSGLAPSSDTATQQAQVASTRSQLPPLEQAIAQAKNRLALLLALPPGELTTKLGVAPLPALPPEIPVGLPSELLRRRPDVRQREAEIEAATARVGVATASLFPGLRLGATAGLQATQASNLFEWASRFFLGGVQLSIPVFEGGRLRAQVKVADAQAGQAVLAYRQTVLGAFHDVDNALVAYASEQHRTMQLRQQASEARRGRELSEARYRSGLAAYIEVLDAERTSHQAELGVARSTVDATTDLVALFKALGGGWDEAEVAAR